MKYNKMIFATHNQGKLEQIRTILKLYNLNVDVICSKDVKYFEDVEENGETFRENAEIKANALYYYCKNRGIDDSIIFADDSGLCVDNLDGQPGVYSSRYAGENASEDDKRNKVLSLMEKYIDDEDRKASFITEMVAILPDGSKIETKGECRGKIAKEMGKTSNRLTYNQIFIPDGFDKPISEMNEQEFKKVHNHREQALLKLINELKIKGVLYM